MKKQYALLALFLLYTSTLFPQTSAAVDAKAITEILTQHTRADLPGVAVGIVQAGQIIHEQYLGYANLEHQVKVGPQTRLNIASNAKQFTALCILSLVEQGKLSLDDDFRTYLPDFYPDIQTPITIASLITHTSGIRDYCDLIALTGKTWWKQFIDNDDALEMLVSQKDLNFPPETEYLYSNSNYILLAEIIKKVSGQDFSEFAKALFERLDMPNTAFLTHYMEIIPHKAAPYGNWGSWRAEPTITEVHGDGALYTTLPDQLKWEQIIQRNDGSYLSQALVNKTQAPIAGAFTQAYGYGLMFESNRGLDYHYHDGVTGAFSATFLRLPNNLSIVVMSNNRSVPANYVAWQIASLLLELGAGSAGYPAAPDTIEHLSQLQEVVGLYQGEGGTVIRILEKDGSLYREIYQRDPVKLIQEQEGLFEYETLQGLKMNFTHIGTPKQQFTLYKSTQKPSSYRKLSNLDFDGFDKQELNGQYYNDETDTEILLEFKEGNSYTLAKNGRERQAEMILADFLRMNSYEIKVMRDEKAQVIGLKVNNRRIQNVIFNKK